MTTLQEIQYLDAGEADHLSTLSEVLVKINRCAVVVKGGRRFSFSALSVSGNRGGVVGIGFGKGRQVPSAIEKAPASSPATPMIRIERPDSSAPATPMTRLRFETSPSLAPSTAARSQPMRSTRCVSR